MNGNGKDPSDPEEHATLVAGPQDDPELRRQHDQTERDLARRHADEADSADDADDDADPREDREPPEPFTGSQH